MYGARGRRGGRYPGQGRARGDSGGPGGFQGRNPPDRTRALYTKFMRDDRVTMDRKANALRFIEGMQATESMPRLLADLMDDRKPGTRRLEEVLSFCESVNDITDLLVPVLRCAINPEMNNPLNRGLRLRYLHAIYRTPGLGDFLTEDDLLLEISQEEANLLCQYLLLVAKAYGEPRNDKLMATMAETLRRRRDVDAIDALYCVLLVDEKKEHAEAVKKRAADMIVSKTTRACWAPDLVPPGGRHDNDFMNYRDIRIVPTPEELKYKDPSFLPLASGENTYALNPIQRLLDRNFRLLREDAVNAMRECIHEGKRVWNNARIIDIDLSNRSRDGSISFLVQVDHQMSSRAVDWSVARTLMRGSVLAFRNNENNIVRSGTITIRNSEEKGKWMNAPGGPTFGVYFENMDDFDDALKEMTHNRPLLDGYMKAFKSGDVATMKLFLDDMTVYQLIEVSNSFFAYRPILKALQNIDTIPLSDELVHQQAPTDAVLSYLPPNIRFPGGDHFHGHVWKTSMGSLENLVENTTLDGSQASAVMHALTSRVSLIQGPPGTGKTFIGGLIAQIILQNSTEKILCVCYTNHALDQFLEHMLDYGANDVVRLGGRSKSARLEAHNIHKLALSNKTQIDGIGRRIKQVDAQMHKLRETLEEATKRLEEEVTWEQPDGGIKAILALDDVLEFVTLPDEFDGFMRIGAKGKKLKDDYLWSRWVDGKGPSPLLQPYMVHDREAFQEFWSRPAPQRARFVNEVKQQVLGAIALDLHGELETLKALAQESETLRQAKNLDTLKHARVIGATTAGAATYREILSEVSPGVVIVEEAGEVLEAHVLSALTADPLEEKATKHLILIGDHKQLRPKVESYMLSAVSGQGYDLDVSLFERLILGGLDSVTLQVQHRMRPSISSIIRAQTYPNLVDHESVTKYPGIIGVEESVDGIVFIDHRRFEDGAAVDSSHSDRSTTKSNAFEVDLAIEIVRFLLLQGYSPDRIVVLTPYVGQLLLLIRAMKRLHEVQAYVSEKDLRDLEDVTAASESIEPATAESKSVRISSIDNFQGEESDIVIVSLVRSNDEGNIGFLAETQRVNVLLSRARHGMILIGNSETLVRKKAGRNTWDPVLSILAERNQIRDGLPTVCQLHPDDTPIILRQPIEFRGIRPNGGCQRPCLYRLSCGHVCPQMCHPLDRQHKVAEQHCIESCRRVPPNCPHRHPCTKRCKDACAECLFRMGPIDLLCGHMANNLQCFQTNSPAVLELIHCRAKVETTLQKCAHKITTTCSNARSPSPVCPMPCDKLLGCGHLCIARCGTCEEKHACGRKCERLLFCGHACDRKCHSDASTKCGPCDKPCINKCSHSMCPKSCKEPCASCVEPCDWRCEHQGECPLVCGSPCTRLPCNVRCDKELSCGHQCPSVCGEPCPGVEYCIECTTNESILSRTVDHFEFKTYREYADQLDEDPVVVLGCGHVFAMSTLDGHMEIHMAYGRNPDGTFTHALPLNHMSISEKAKQCPDCRTAIHSIGRYSRITKYGLLRSLQRKHLEWIDRRLKLLQKKDPEKRSVRVLKTLLKDAKTSPFQQVYDASRQEGDEPPSSSSGPIIRTLMLMGETSASKSQGPGNENFLHTLQYFEEAIVYAKASESLRSEASAHLALARHLVPWIDSDASLMNVILGHLDVVIDGTVVFPEFRTPAVELKEMLSDNDTRQKELQEVLKAMGTVDGYNYGTAASDHWFQCPNGHPYFIGECGGAMEESRCPECQLLVGGRDHALLQTNSHWSGLSDLR